MKKVMIDEDLWGRMVVALSVADPGAFAPVMSEAEYFRLLRDIEVKVNAMQRRVEYSQNLEKHPR